MTANAISSLVSRHKNGSRQGIFSVCSAHPLVLEAALLKAKHNDTFTLIEATSNQVNQFGGYTGMTPAEFRDSVLALAEKVGLPAEQVVLGGDHLGPNCWQDESAAAAMQNSDALINDYVTAGFRKIHLDCSMSCADDAERLDDEEVARRAARLCRVAEDAWQSAGGEAPVYVIGTEVPPPGGATEAIDHLAVTSPEAARNTLSVHREAFEKKSLAEAWERVIGLVVQPGVEFGNDTVADYDRQAASSLSAVVDDYANLVFEAHSTDYQTTDSLRRLVEDHFAILKVGPALTYALREGLWALDHIDSLLHGDAQAADLRKVVVGVMKDDPRHWQKFYDDEDAQLRVNLQFSLTDRIRYYWPVPAVVDAVDKLMQNLDRHALPMTLIRQYLPAQHRAIRAGEIGPSPRELLIHKIDAVLNQYAAACGVDG